MSFPRLVLVPAAVVFSSLSLFGCAKDAPTASSSSGKPAASGGSVAPRSATSGSRETAAPPKAASGTNGASEEKAASKEEDIKVDLPAILGTKKDGFAPKVLSGLKRGMKPDEAAKVVPGAEKVSKFGFVEVPVQGHPGLEGLKLYFAKDKDGVPNELQSVQLQFSPALNNDAFWGELSKACIERYGKADDKEIQKRLITWVGPKSGMAQLVTGLTENHGFTLDITLPR